MSFIVQQDRPRLSFPQPSILPSFQLQQTAVRSSQAPTSTSSFSFQPADLSYQQPHPHSEGFISLSERNNNPNSLPRNDPSARAPENQYLLRRLQEAAHNLVPSQPRQPQDPTLSLSNVVNAENIEGQVPSDSSTEGTRLEIANMTRPPEGIFPTFEALLAAANHHAFSRGYAFVIGRSKKKNKLGLKKVLLSCDKGGTSHHKMLPPDSEKRRRRTQTRKTGCEFGVYAIESQTEWTLKYRPDPTCSMHNHGPSKNVADHPAARKLNPTAVAAVKAMKEAGVSAQETLKEIQRENPGTLLIARDVYNARAALRREPPPDRNSVRDVDGNSSGAAGASSSSASAAAPPQIYRRNGITSEDRLRDDLRLQVTKAREELERTKEEWRKEVEGLRGQIKDKDKAIAKFEMFIDMCNERVMVNRERLMDEDGTGTGGGGGGGGGSGGTGGSGGGGGGP